MQIDSITLPENLYWSDEMTFKSHVQSKTRSVTGRPVISHQALLHGRPITLTGAWITRADLAALTVLENEPGTHRTLTLNNGDTHQVLFDLEQGGVEAVPEYPLSTPLSNPDDNTLYRLTIHLITVGA